MPGFINQPGAPSTNGYPQQQMQGYQQPVYQQQQPFYGQQPQYGGYQQQQYNPYNSPIYNMALQSVENLRNGCYQGNDRFLQEQQVDPTARQMLCSALGNMQFAQQVALSIANYYGNTTGVSPMNVDMAVRAKVQAWLANERNKMYQRQQQQQYYGGYLQPTFGGNPFTGGGNMFGSSQYVNGSCNTGYMQPYNPGYAGGSYNNGSNGGILTDSTKTAGQQVQEAGMYNNQPVYNSMPQMVQPRNQQMQAAPVQPVQVQPQRRTPEEEAEFKRRVDEACKEDEANSFENRKCKWEEKKVEEADQIPADIGEIEEKQIASVGGDDIQVNEIRLNEPMHSVSDVLSELKEVKKEVCDDKFCNVVSYDTLKVVKAPASEGKKLVDTCVSLLKSSNAIDAAGQVIRAINGSGDTLKNFFGTILLDLFNQAAAIHFTKIDNGKMKSLGTITNMTDLHALVTGQDNGKYQDWIGTPNFIDILSKCINRSFKVIFKAKKKNYLDLTQEKDRITLLGSDEVFFRTKDGVSSRQLGTVPATEELKREVSQKLHNYFGLLVPVKLMIHDLDDYEIDADNYKYLPVTDPVEEQIFSWCTEKYGCDKAINLRFPEQVEKPFQIGKNPDGVLLLKRVQ